MRAFLKVFFSILTVLYPVLVFVLLVVYQFPVRIISLCVIALALVFFLSATGNASKDSSGKRKFNPKNLLSSALFLAVGILCFATNSSLFLKLYPVALCGTFLFAFGMSLFSPPCIVFRFATMQDKTILQSVNKKRIEKYCKKVTCVWCAFFVLNIAAAIYTAFFCSERVWSVYNGGISYIIMGIIFAIEFLVRKRLQNTSMYSADGQFDSQTAIRAIRGAPLTRSFYRRSVNKKMAEYYSISKFKASDRKDNFVMCYEDTWTRGVYKTWKDFLTDSAKMRAYIQTKTADEWILHCNDYWYFLTTFVALLQCKKQVMLTANITPAFIEEMRKPGWEFLSDAKDAPKATDIPTLMASLPAPSEDEIRTTPRL